MGWLAGADLAGAGQGQYVAKQPWAHLALSSCRRGRDNHQPQELALQRDFDHSQGLLQQHIPDTFLQTHQPRLSVVTRGALPKLGGLCAEYCKLSGLYAER